jgi:hypothetical protein
MTIEVAALIHELNASYPAAPDWLYEGDDHIRLTKAALKATFPNVTGIVTASHTKLNQAGGPGSWILQATTTSLSGGPAAVDFVNGTGGVVMDSSYDAHLLQFSNFEPSTNAELLLQISTDSGSTWTGFTTTLRAQAITIAAGTVAGAVITSSSNFKLSGGRNVVAGAGVTSKVAGEATLFQNTSQGTVFAVGQIFHGVTAAEEACHSFGRSSVTSSLQNPINGIRLTWSAGVFGSASALFRLYSRKVS